MESAEAFLWTILDQPNDDGPRLVYADWLEERGDPLAELIRLQIEIEGVGGVHQQLEARVQELLECHRETWFEPIQSLGLSGCFRRGLMEVSITGVSLFLDLAPALFQMPHVLAIRLSDAAVQPSTLIEFAMSPHFGRVQHLNLNRSRIGNDGVAAWVDNCPECRLISLNLGQNDISSRGILRLVDRLRVSQLTELRLAGNGIGDAGAKALAGTPRLSRLRTLDLSYNQLGTVGGEYLAESPFLGQLTNLNLRGNSIGNRGKRALRRRFGLRVRLAGTLEIR
jgi:uncharacterized protein (TIGR02996 family)